jgi:hypothetical protein
MPLETAYMTSALLAGRGTDSLGGCCPVALGDSWLDAQVGL